MDYLRRLLARSTNNPVPDPHPRQQQKGELPVQQLRLSPEPQVAAQPQSRHRRRESHKHHRYRSEHKDHRHRPDDQNRGILRFFEDHPEPIQQERNLPDQQQRTNREAAPSPEAQLAAKSQSHPRRRSSQGHQPRRSSWDKPEPIQPQSIQPAPTQPAPTQPAPVQPQLRIGEPEIRIGENGKRIISIVVEGTRPDSPKQEIKHPNQRPGVISAVIQGPDWRIVEQSHPPRPTSTLIPTPTPSPEPQSPWQTQQSGLRRKPTNRRLSVSFSMPTQFTGPSCGDLVEFMKTVKEMPKDYQGSFHDLSEKAIAAICDEEALHIWEGSDDVDDMLQLAQAIVKLKILVDAQEVSRKKEVAMVIISSEKDARQNGRNGFERLCDFVSHIMDSEGKKHVDGTVMAFDAIVVVRGISYLGTSDESGAVRRINIAIERVFKMMRPSTKQLVWHHGPVLSLLLTWMNTTSKDLRSTLTAISVTAALDLANGVKPSPLGKANSPADIQRLEEYANRLSIPVVFVDPASQLIIWEYPANYMWYFAYFIHTLLPHSIIRPHFYKAIDNLITFAFRIRGAADTIYDTSAVTMVQAHITASNARSWAKNCIDAASFTKTLCRAAALEREIHHAVQLSEAPFELLTMVPNYPLPAFSRLCLGPTKDPAKSTGEDYLAAPVTFNFQNCEFRATSSTPFYILLPREGNDAEKVTGRIQGMMMGVLERIKREKGEPPINEREKEAWGEVATAVRWALDGCKGKCPDGVEEKITHVRTRLDKGTWGCCFKTWEKERNEKNGSGWGTQGAQSSSGWQGAAGSQAGNEWSSSTAAAGAGWH